MTPRACSRPLRPRRAAEEDERTHSGRSGQRRCGTGRGHGADRARYRERPAGWVWMSGRALGGGPRCSVPRLCRRTMPPRSTRPTCPARSSSGLRRGSRSRDTSSPCRQSDSGGRATPPGRFDTKRRGVSSAAAGIRLPATSQAIARDLAALGAAVSCRRVAGSRYGAVTPPAGREWITG